LIVKSNLYKNIPGYAQFSDIQTSWRL